MFASDVWCDYCQLWWFLHEDAVTGAGNCVLVTVTLESGVWFRR